VILPPLVFPVFTIQATDLIPPDRVVLELLGDHECGVVVLEEPLLVEPGVQPGKGLPDGVDVNLGQGDKTFSSTIYECLQ